MDHGKSRRGKRPEDQLDRVQGFREEAERSSYAKDIPPLGDPRRMAWYWRKRSHPTPARLLLVGVSVVGFVLLVAVVGGLITLFLHR